jgi:hypothetical protein
VEKWKCPFMMDAAPWMTPHAGDTQTWLPSDFEWDSSNLSAKRRRGSGSTPLACAFQAGEQQRCSVPPVLSSSFSQQAAQLPHRAHPTLPSWPTNPMLFEQADPQQVSLLGDTQTAAGPARPAPESQPTQAVGTQLMAGSSHGGHLGSSVPLNQLPGIISISDASSLQGGPMVCQVCDCTSLPRLSPASIYPKRVRLF